jgi:4-hydroxy-3-polyprenylbenzoate decarboxylase
MSYRSMQAVVDDLAATRQIVRIEEEVDPYLEAAEIQRRVYAAGGPAIYYAHVKGCRFPMVSNLFGTIGRARYLFRDTLDAVRKLIELKIDPTAAQRKPLRYFNTLATLWNMRPKMVSRGPVAAFKTTIDQLPRLQSWPDDGGAYITLPQVYTEDAERPGWQKSNLGMYRVQLSSKHYQPNAEVGLHYQIHRGIGVHHAAALRAGKPFRANIFVGGTPAMTLAAVMPLPEGMSELSFAGALAGHRIPLMRTAGLPIYADADFCIAGVVEGMKPEGPFGDHLGYYSLAHDFPVLRVEKVFHRAGAIWPFTVVGRPPQEDTVFGELIHELTGPIIPTIIPGLHAVHAVDATGVHPLLLAVGSERYTPYEARRQPMELLTTANAILGQGQLSLAKYLLIVAKEDDPSLDIRDVAAFLRHVLERFDPQRDLHFQTCTTIDTLDYSGTGLNEGSKLVIAAAGPKRRELPTEIGDLRLPEGFSDPELALPGVLVIQSKTSIAGGQPPSRPHRVAGSPPANDVLSRFCTSFTERDAINRFPLVVLADDSEFTAGSLHNFLWIAFTRSNPASDIDGIGSFVRDKHWGCTGSVVIDARIKPRHAPPLVEDAAVTARVNQLAARGGPLHGIL